MRRSFDAWHLPGLTDTELDIASYDIGTLDVRAPRLTTEQLSLVLESIASTRSQGLLQLPLTRIMDAITGAAARMLAGGEARELVAAATGYSLETVDDVLGHMARDWSRDSLEALVHAELGSLEKPGPHVSQVPVGPGLAFHIFAGNVPGVAVTSLIRALFVRAASLGKTASGEPVLAVLFARALAATEPLLGGSIAVTYWPGGSEALEAIALQDADTVIVYGGAETVTSVSARLPEGTRLVEHGPRLSLGVVGPAAALDVAGPIAAAVAAYDQQGCVSPHVVFVEAGGPDPVALAAAIAAELEILAAKRPRRRLDTSEILAIRAARDHAEFRAIAGAAQRVFGAADLSYTVIFDDNATLHASCLNRTLYVKPIASIDALSALLAPHRHVMQCVALAGFSDERIDAFARVLAAVGVTRITTFEQLPWPPMTWHHDGRGPLRELLHWMDIER